MAGFAGFWLLEATTRGGTPTMLVLADRPDAGKRAFGPITPQRRSVGELSPTDARLWRALSPAQALWVAEVDLPPGPTGPWWARAIVIEHAERSQYDALADFFRDGGVVAGPVACLALTGDAFHGHRGRPWQAVAGNLHLSVGLQPQKPVSLLVPALSMLPAVATLQAVQAFSSGAPRAAIKWVNDILVGDDKLAGVLTSTQTRGNSVRAAVLGIGLNVAQAPAVRPTPFVPSTSCLAAVVGARCPSLAEIFAAVLTALARRYEQLLARGPAELFRAYCAASLVVGRRVRIWDESVDPESAGWPPPLAQGIVESIEPDLRLRLRGCAEPVAKGRLALERACRHLAR